MSPASPVGFPDPGAHPDLPPTRLPSTRSPFVAGVARNLLERCAVLPGARLLLAVSGGADSVALLLTLAALARRPHLRFQPIVASIDHGLRPESAAEVSFVARLAQRFDLPFIPLRIAPARRAGNLADNARRERYAALARAAAESESVAVVTAHHGSDQLETIVAALLRGAGPAGLAGMPWAAHVETEADPCRLVRPLLDRTHEDCVALCRQQSAPWVEDPTNRRPDTLRGRMRAELIPALRGISPDIEARIWRTGEALREMDATINELAVALLKAAALPPSGEPETAEAGNGRRGGSGRWRRSALAAARPIVCATALRRAALDLGIAADRLGFEAAEHLSAAVRDGVRRPRVVVWPDGLRWALRRDEIQAFTQEREHEIR